MSRATISNAGHWFHEAFRSKAKPTGRRTRRPLGTCCRRLEFLEDRTMLDASMDAAVGSTLTPSTTQPSVPAATEGVRLTDAATGAFEDSDASPDLGGFIVSIDWGDDAATSFGRVVQPGGPGTTLYVLGSHTYADSAPPGAVGPVHPVYSPSQRTYTGTFSVLIHVQDSGGSATTISNEITVQGRPLTISGGLDPASDSGASSSDEITNVVRPTFRGRVSEGGATIRLDVSAVFIVPKVGLVVLPVSIGTTVADASGAWSFTVDDALYDGIYWIQAQAFDSSSLTNSDLTMLTSNLVVDTVGPKVLGLTFNRAAGEIVVQFIDRGGNADGGVGLDLATVVDANNYRFTPAGAAIGPRRAARWIIGGIAVEPGGTTGPQVATIKVNDGRALRGGRYLFTARSIDPSNLTGVQDLAGNALDGEFYSFFPSGNNHVGGDYVAELDAVHRRILAARTTIGTASPITPPGTRGAYRLISRPIRSSPAAARKAPAAANPLHARRLAGVNLSRLR